MKIYRNDGSLIGEFESVEAAVKAGADLSHAILSRANLSHAILSRANLFGADLSCSDLSRANLKNTKLPPISILPEGAIIGWKKLQNNVICKLEIPAEASRVNSTRRKCRAEYAKVLWLSEGAEGCGTYDSLLLYRVGKIVRPDSYDPDFRVECSHGIHFFITREEAESYA